MQINGIEVCDECVERFLLLSNLPGDDPDGIKQVKLIALSAASKKIPEWMYSSGIEYFDKNALLKVNEHLAMRMQSVAPWMVGNKVVGVYPGEVDLNNLILIAYNILDDLSAAIFLDGGSWKLIFLGRVDGKLCWRVAYDQAEDFLIDLGI